MSYSIPKLYYVFSFWANTLPTIAYLAS